MKRRRFLALATGLAVAKGAPGAGAGGAALVLGGGGCRSTTTCRALRRLFA